MPLQKQTVNINFAQGLDKKTDPYQIPIGKFAELKNSVFDSVGRMTKRNGFAPLAALPSTDYSYITTFKSNLTALGPSVAAYSDPTDDWIASGNYTPINLEVETLVRNNANQVQSDSATAPNGLVCVAFTQTLDFITYTYSYSVLDAESGQPVIPQTTITPASGVVDGYPQVYVVGNYFIIAYGALHPVNDPHLEYFAINSTTLAVSAAVSIYNPFNGSFAAVNVNNVLYFVYGDAIFGGVKMNTLSSSLVLGPGYSPSAIAGADDFSICADTTGVSAVLWINFFSISTTLSYAMAVDTSISVLLAPTNTGLGLPTGLHTLAAQNDICTIYAQIGSTLPNDTGVQSDYINTVKIPLSGTTVTITIAAPGVVTTAGPHGLSVGDGIRLATTGALPTGLTAGTLYYVYSIPSATSFQLTTSPNGFTGPITTSGTQSGVQSYTNEALFAQSVGLATKAFIVDDVQYVTATYQSPFQATYFLLNEDGEVVTKIAYQNGAGYRQVNGVFALELTNLAGVTVLDRTAQFSYLTKTLVNAVNRETAVGGVVQSSGIYSQIGTDLALVKFSEPGDLDVIATETGNNLNVSGGFLWAYDGTLLNENNFFLWPELIPDTEGENNNIETDSTTTVTPTGDVTNLTNLIYNLSSYLGIYAGCTIAGTGIPGGTTVLGIVSTPTGQAVLISKYATASGTGVTLTIAGAIAAQTYFYQFCYEWQDNQGNYFRSAPSVPVSIVTTGSTSENTIYVPMLTLTYKVNPTSPVKIVGYRWSTAQQVYYQFTSLLQPSENDPTQKVCVIVDAHSDASILGNNILYTTGGVLENVNGPASNIFTLFDDRFWMVDAEDRNLLWFSKQVIQGTPVEMSDLLTFFVAPTIGGQGSTGDITALGNMDDKLIICKRNAFYYINGVGPDNTGANNQYSQPIFITSPVGCDNQRSITMIPQGLMFQSDKGIWLLGRNLMVSYIGAEVEQYNNLRVTSATTIPKTNQVRFTLEDGTVLMYDYFVGQWAVFEGASGISSTVYENYQTLLGDDGIVYQETPGIYSDGDSPVLMSFKTGWLNLQGLRGYQRAYFAFLLGTYLTPHSLRIACATDYEVANNQTEDFVPSLTATDPEQFRFFFKRQRSKAVQFSVSEFLDASLGQVAGAGLTISGINVQIAAKKGFAPIGATKSVS